MPYQDWKNHPEDFLIVEKQGINSEGQQITSYLLIEFASGKALSHILEDHGPLIEAMITGGVMVVDIDEFTSKQLMIAASFRAHQKNQVT